LLLQLPHRQFVWTIPEILPAFLRHDRDLFADIGRLLFDILTSFFDHAAGRTLRCAMVSSHRSSEQSSRCNPHWHSLFLERGPDRDGRFVHVPTVDAAGIRGCSRRRVSAFFLERKPLSELLAKNMVSWADSRSWT
jgi:hypothetical protein